MKNFSGRGYTLVEVMVAMAILLLIFFIVGDFIYNGFRSFRYGSEFDEAVVNARRAMEIMSKEIRGANISDRGDYPIVSAGEQSLVFYSDIDFDGDFDQVRYYISGRTLYKVVIQPGTARDYSETPATTTIALFVNNEDQEAFQYYDGTVAQTSDLDSIRLIRMRLLFNVNPGISPDDIVIETDVSLRNLKSNL